MALTFNADQEELRRAVRSFMERESPSSYVRAMTGDGCGFRDEVCDQIVWLDGHTADWALIVARTEQGIGTFLVEAPNGELVPAWDVTRKVARLSFDALEAEPVGPHEDQTHIWQRIVDDTNVALCAELVG